MSFTAKSDDTIFAIASLPQGSAGGAAVAVIRISGDAAAAALRALLGDQLLPPPRELAFRKLYHPETQTLLDEAMVAYFPAPHSFTGEAVCELHTHGGAAVLLSLTETLASLENLRVSEAGEFTRRAVLNGKMDLTQAEAIADLIEAQGAAQQTKALQQLEGQLRRQFTKWRDELTQILAHLEADIEFADEDLSGKDENIIPDALAKLPALRAQMATYIEDKRGERLREGLRVVLTGAPNVGKSSLLNALAARPAAIVAPTQGTTRDFLEIPMILAGVPIILVDTAGLRAHEPDDPIELAIEKESIRRALEQAETADIRLEITAFMTDSAQITPKLHKNTPKNDVLTQNTNKNPAKNLDDDSPKTRKSPKSTKNPLNSSKMQQITLKIHNKCDLVPKKPANSSQYDTLISAKTGEGIPELLAILENLIKTHFIGESTTDSNSDSGILTRQRHRAALQEAVICLDRALNTPQSPELICEDIRLAHRALGKVTGAVDIESLLDVVFADFCVGK